MAFETAVCQVPVHVEVLLLVQAPVTRLGHLRATKTAAVLQVSVLHVAVLHMPVLQVSVLDVTPRPTAPSRPGGLELLQRCLGASRQEAPT
eukprot:COSAG01_NODE_1192_length_11309_cov_8.575609_8_plen_91_part_00